MKRRLFQCIVAVLLGLGLAALLLWPDLTNFVQAAGEIHYVAPPPVGNDNGGSNNCQTAGTPCATIQQAINMADDMGGDTIYIAAGTYTGTAGPVAVITKELVMAGAYASDFSTQDPDLYQTTLDAQGNGSVISITNAGDVQLMHLTLTHGNGTGNCGTSTGCGGGIYAANTSLHVGHCVVTNNVASEAGGGMRWGWGGGIFAEGNTNVDIWSSRIVSNTANANPLSDLYSYGGGIFIRSATVLLKENQILDNVGSITGTGGMGGGIYLYSAAQAHVLTNTIKNNKASVHAGSGNGGGVYIFAGTSTSYLAANHIENNLTSPDHTGYGGGVYLSETEVHLNRNTIISNATSLIGWMNPGGGVFIASSKSVTLSNNLIADNQAGIYGGGIYVTRNNSPASQALLVNNTIANNGASGVVGYRYAVLTLTNNLIVSHTTGVTTFNPFTGSISADTNLFWNTADPLTGTNAIQQDPLLTAAYRPSPDSPAIDAGLTVSWLTTDLAGITRPQRSGYDLGAFEFGEQVVYLPLVLKNS